ncbi:hypothetical protein MMC07_002048 [Pseudocyphellaria aurata]|nr:hypothetical protein [Pseudocyphellaria aurata]
MRKSRKKGIVWTVEWIHNGGRSELGTCSASVSISDAYAAHCVPIAQTKKRKRGPAPPDPPSTSTTTSNRPLPPPPPLPSASTPPSSPSSRTAKPSLHFYLLRPCTPPSTRVLIPLPCSTATLATSLRDQLVLEFPTIYALKYPPEKLPTGFVTEADHLAQRRTNSQREGVIWSGSDREEDPDMLRSGHADRDAEVGGAGTAAGAGEEAMDANQFLAVLARDLGSVSEILAPPPPLPPPPGAG